MAPDLFREQRDRGEGNLGVPYVYFGILFNAAILTPESKIQIIAEIRRDLC